MRRIRIGAAAGMTILGATAIASAQMPDKGSEPSTRERAPEGKTMREPSGAQSQPDIQRPTTDQPGKDTPKGADRPDKDRPKTTDQPAKDRPKGAERPDRDGPKTTDQPAKDRPKGAERPDRDGPKTTDQPAKDRPKGAERPDRDVPKTTDQPAKDRPKGAERPDRDGPRAVERPDSDKGASGRARLSAQQRGEIGTKLRETRIEKTRVRVNVAIGSRIPRSVRVHVLPGPIIAMAPAYRGYSYFVLEDDTIVIVNPRTLVVIDTLPPSTRTAGLVLSTDQMRFIFERVPRDRTVDIRARLALGAEVPRDVELLAFPPEVLARIPEVEGYRYVVADRDVVIVDPRDNAVALVISE